MSVPEVVDQDARSSHADENIGVTNDGDEEEEGVLLYYKFVQIPEPEKIKCWVFTLSSSLGLLGRIRVAPDGINVTVGGKMKALHEHIRIVGSDPLFQSIDFKLASSRSPVNNKVAAECGFTSLSARIVKELVTLGLHPSVEPPSVSKAGKHVTAQEFHEILESVALVSGMNSGCNLSLVDACTGMSNDDGENIIRAAGMVRGSEFCNGGRKITDYDSLSKLPQDLAGVTGDGSGICSKKVVVIDARNLYETRIGQFCPPQGVEVMDPLVRKYSDLPGWIDENEAHLRNHRILMYCTGGVRCEMASAYIRSKGKEFEDVLQLSGGIQRYLEAYPGGGYFRGKNFVFDHRLAVPSTNTEVVGSCLLCKAPFDDYSARCRCSFCRMLVLVCLDCQNMAVPESSGQKYTCEVCSKDKKTLKTSRQSQPHGTQEAEGFICNYEPKAPLSETKGADQVQYRKLRILCLHGFRQSASSLKGRLNSLRKKLRQKVELVFVDAPHEIPSVKMCSIEEFSCAEEVTRSHLQEKDPGSEEASHTRREMSKKYAWLISPTTVADYRETPRSKSPIARLDDVNKCDDLQAQRGTVATVPSRQQSELDSLMRSLDCSPGHLATLTSSSLQYQTQTHGWARSWDYLKSVFTEMGPFDGVLGFSQGAAVAAALCSGRQGITSKDVGPSFSFVILCSGFCSPAVEHQQLMSISTSGAAIDCPSLHVFGGSPGLDRQIDVHKSDELASLFIPDKRSIIRHNSGHIIPTQPEYVEQYLKFLGQFK